MSDNTPDPTPKPTPPPKADTDWKDQEIRSLRDESASRRVENNTLKEQVATLQGQIQTANTQIEQLTGTANESASALLKLSVALKAGVPGDQAVEFAELLQGSNEQELLDYAEKIRKFNGGPTAVSPAYDPTQGRGLSGANTPMTPEQEFFDLLRKKGLA